MKDKVKDPYLLVLIALSFVLRFFNLWYSDYQGDEIKALYLPEDSQNIWSYFLDQRKGPIQFIITYLLKFINPDYSNEFLIRLPFAIAGFLSVIFFYKLLVLIFDRKIAFYASFFFATNGFFIAFSRIVQYQSFVILFGVLAVYFLARAHKYQEFFKKGIFFSLLSWSLSILAHYDGIFFAPIIMYFLYLLYKANRPAFTKQLLISGSVALVLLASFYIPFFLNISEATSKYWQGRLTGII